MSVRLPDWTGAERAGRWAAEVARVLTATVASLQAQINRKQTIGDIVSLKPYTVAELSAVSPTLGSVVMVSNEIGGAVLAFGDGVAWRRATDRAVVS